MTMKVIRMDLTYPKRVLEAAAGEPAPRPEQITLNVIITAVNLVYNPQNKRQMSVQELRIWSRIQDRLMDENGKALAGPIDLSDEQFDFIHAKLNEAQYPPNFATVITILLDSFDRIKLDKTEPKEART